MKLPISAPKSTETATLFIHQQEGLERSFEKCNIVLSPAYYWFKREQLPVKSVTQAKKLAPSLFDGVIPEGEYSYHVVKHEEAFWLFAYSDAMIVAKLTQLGLRASQINNVFFAQTECTLEEGAYRIDDTHALAIHEATASLVPVSYVQTNGHIADCFEGHKFTKHSVGLNFFQNSFIDEKYIYRLIGVAVAMIVVYFGNYLLLRGDLAQAKGMAYAINEKYQLPQTSFELEGLKNGLYGKQKRQIAFRENIKALLGISLLEGEYVKKIDISEKSAQYEIVMKEPKRAEAIKKEAEKSFKVSSAKVIDATLYMSVAL